MDGFHANKSWRSDENSVLFLLITYSVIPRMHVKEITNILLVSNLS